MKRTLLLAIAFSISIGLACGQVTKTITEPGDLASADLAGATSITVAGEWDDTNLGLLRDKMDGEDVRTTLTSFDMSEAAFSGDITNGLDSMFYNFVLLESVKLPSAGHSETVSFYYTFYWCASLEIINLNAFTQISDLSYAFTGCAALTSVTMPAINSSTSDVLFNYTFFSCKKLEAIELSGFNNIGSLNSTFSYCEKLTIVTLPSVNSSTGEVSFSNTFNQCKLLQEIDISGFTKIKNMINAFSDCKMLTSVTLPASNSSTSEVSFNSAFYLCALLEEVDISGFTNISTMIFAFSGCEKLTSVALSSANTTTNDVSFSQAFLGCTLLQEIDLSGFTKMSYMDFAFSGCEKLVAVILPSANTSMVNTSFHSTFHGCTLLHEIDFSGFTNIGSLNLAFSNCSALTSVLFSNIPASADLSNAFHYTNPNCLKYIDDVSFDNTRNWKNVILPTGTDNAWQAMDDIVLDGTKPFHAPEAFTMAEGKVVSYTMDISGCKTVSVGDEITVAWATLCLPFDAKMFHPTYRGQSLKFYNGVTGNFLLSEYIGSDAEGEVAFARVKSVMDEEYAYIRANTPYLISFLGSSWVVNGIAAGSITLLSTADGVAATPDGGISVGKGDLLFASAYRQQNATATEELYVLTGAAGAQTFAKNSGVALNTFEAYFTGTSAETSLSIIDVGYTVVTETITEPGDLASVDLAGATHIIVTGEWNYENLFSLREKLAREVKVTLISFDMSGATLSGDIPIGFGLMFSEFSLLKSVEFPSVGHSGEVHFGNMFQNCVSLMSADLSGFTNIKSLNSVFSGCESLTTVTLPEDTDYADGISFFQAFRNCKSLTSPINLSGFTKISNLGHTFFGCESLTSVTLGSIPTSIDTSNAFYNTNPNSLKYIDDASFDNTKYYWTNVILPIGTGNTWQATGSIVLDGERPFHSFVNFAPAAGKTISYAMNISSCKTVFVSNKVTVAWAAICLPFDAYIVHPANDGTYLSLFDESTGRGHFLLREYTASPAVGEVTFTDVAVGTSIKANVPYLISFLNEIGHPGNSVTANDITFIATADGIATTPNDGVIVGEDNHIFCSFYRPMDATETEEFYVFNGDTFDKESGLPVGTFEPFFMDDAPPLNTSLSIGGADVLTSLIPGRPQDTTGNGLQVYANGVGSLRVESNCTQQVMLYTATGIQVRTIVLSEGTTYVTGLQPGVYILGGKKTVVL